MQSHHRAERGTTCYLAGRCRQPNAYADDAAIAAALRRRWPPQLSLAGSTLWVTVQAGVVYFEGCVADRAQAAALERFALSTPEVRQAIAVVMVSGDPRPPYALWSGTK